MTTKQIKRLNELVSIIGLEAYGKLTSNILILNKNGEYNFEIFLRELGSNTKLSEIVASYFTWSDSSEGVPYWSDIHSKLLSTYDYQIPKNREALYNALDSEVYVKFIANVEDEECLGCGLDWLDTHLLKNKKTMQGILSGAFVWGMTPEGHPFWVDVFLKLKNK